MDQWSLIKSHQTLAASIYSYSSTLCPDEIMIGNTYAMFAGAGTRARGEVPLDVRFNTLELELLLLLDPRLENNTIYGRCKTKQPGKQLMIRN